MAKALPVDVYRWRYDCTNDGVSSKFDTLLVLCDDGFKDVDLDNPPDNLCRVVHRFQFGRDIYHIEPLKPTDPGCVGWMAGGNYAATRDSRFSKMIGGMYGAVAIHDRQETQQQYDMMFD